MPVRNPALGAFSACDVLDGVVLDGAFEDGELEDARAHAEDVHDRPIGMTGRSVGFVLALELSDHEQEITRFEPSLGYRFFQGRSRSASLGRAAGSPKLMQVPAEGGSGSIEQDELAWGVMSGLLEGSKSDVEATASIGVHHVGVCVDLSPLSNRILPHGLAFARAFSASLSVLHVLEPQRQEGTLTSTNPLEWEMRRTDVRRHLDGISAEYGSPELPIKTELLKGRVAEEICGWVTSHDVDLTVLCSHGTSGSTKWSLGSTAKKLIEGLSGAVLLVPACVLQEPLTREVIYERILAPLDASPRAESALPPAVRLARIHGSELVLVHAVPVPELTRPAPLDEEELALERRLIDRNTRVGEGYLAQVAGHPVEQGLRVRTVLTADDARFQLLRCIKEERPNLIVVSGHGLSGRTELPLGSVTSFLLEHATAPILIVRERADARESLIPKRGDSESGRLPPLANT